MFAAENGRVNEGGLLKIVFILNKRLQHICCAKKKDILFLIFLGLITFECEQEFYNLYFLVTI